MRYAPATSKEILAVLQPNIGMQTTTVARAVLSERGVADVIPDERGRQSGEARGFVSGVARKLKTLGALPGGLGGTVERDAPRVACRGRKWTITRAGIALRGSTPTEAADQNIAAVQEALADARRARSLPYRALAASAILAGEYAQSRELIAKAEREEVRRG